jgi:hypothetical protein
MINLYAIMMNIPFLFLGLLFSRQETEHAGRSTPIIKTDSIVTWINQFRSFRTAVYQNDRASVKQFMSFPIIQEEHEIWYLVLGNAFKGAPEDGNVKPFTEKDFDRYYTKLFSRNFINGILKIKTDDLYRKGEIETAPMKAGPGLSMIVYASFDKKKHILSINLAYNGDTGTNNGEDADAIEYNEIYQFHVLQDGRLQFHQVRLAG